MVKVVIGRNHQTNQLLLELNGHRQLLGQQNSVPTSVGEKHVEFIVNDDGTMILKNLSIQNDTYVNMVGIESKRIKEGDRIELGNDQYVLKWDILKSLIPKFADIRPLKKVWEDYQKEQDDFQIRQTRMNILRGATGILTMGSIIIGKITNQGEGTLSIFLYVIGGILAVFFIIFSWNEAAKAPQQKRDMADAFSKKYVCPNCGRFLGNSPYYIICQNTKCPYCQAIYKK